MKSTSKITFGAWLAFGLGAVLLHAPAQAALCNLPDSGNAVITVAPKLGPAPTPSPCQVNGLPGVGSDLPGYILKASRTAPIVKSGVTVGTLYDRIYCLGTGTACNATNTYIIAHRVQMLATPVNYPARNPNCPVWDNTSNECFEINNTYRNIRGTSAAAVTADVGYFMGSTSSGSDPNTKLSVKYLEYTGKTYKGLNQASPPSALPRDNTKAMFWNDVNVSDPDGVNAPWSPWFFVKQNCPFPTSGTADHYTLANFAIKYWQGGEEGQIQTNVQDSAYACKTS